jgi:inner membrane protein
MMFRTHLAMGILFALFFLPYMDYKILFLFAVIISSIIPDVDLLNSKVGKSIFFRPLQLFVKHRGLLHSLTFCIVVGILLSFTYPMLAFPFFLGYSSHIILDSLTVEGIRPFWPMKKEVAGSIRTNGRREKIFFYVLLFGIFLSLIRVFVLM